jgi:hypothetical protein
VDDDERAVGVSWLYRRGEADERGVNDMWYGGQEC